jgi:hypothetical protein
VSRPVPPRAERLLRWSLSPLERPAILGDLQEEHAALAQTKGADAAGRWYWNQVLWSVAPNLWRRLQADPRRAAHFRGGLRAMAVGAIWSICFFFDSRITGSWWVVYGLFGLCQVLVALFYKRLEAPSRQRRIEKWSASLAICFFLLLVGYWRPLPSSWLALGLLGLLLIQALWPRLPAEAGAEVRVQPKPGVGLYPSLWSFELPAEPLGLSGLVLHRARAETARDARLPPVTIDRVFTSDVTLRVRTAVNLSGRAERASVELLDRQGKQVWQSPARLVTGKLVEVPANLDELADRDPADHFGVIDEALPLATLAPGLYCLRVTVTNDIFQTSSADEVITIAPGQQP